MHKYKYCPICKGKLKRYKDYFECENCKEKIYIDPKPCISILPIRNGKVLLARRAVEPYKGEYDLIGGFMKIGETLEEAAKREAKEETGLNVEIVKLLGNHPDRYGKGGDFTIGVTFIVKIISGKIRAKDDVASLEWVSINNPPETRGFKNTKENLKDLQKWYKKNLGQDLRKS